MRLIRLLLICVSLLVVLINGPAIEAGAGLVANKFLFVVHVAGLYAKAPDQNLEMPVQGVTKSHVRLCCADASWIELGFQ